MDELPVHIEYGCASACYYIKLLVSHILKLSDFHYGQLFAVG